jgi:uncharacterized protein YjdB
MAVGIAMLIAGCGREFDSPFLPESNGYAGSAWSRDDDGDGVADSVEKYAPDCGGGPAECLRKAQANAGTDTAARRHVPVTSVTAEDIRLAPGETRPPVIRILPTDATDPRYEVTTHDPLVMTVRDGMLTGQSAGQTLATVRTLDGSRQATFGVSVEAVRIPVRRVRVEDMSFTLLSATEGRIRTPKITWTPADATDKGYSLEVEDTRIARVVGGAIEALRSGETKVTLTPDDGGRKQTFEVKVSLLFGCGGLLNPCGDGGDDDGDDD